MNETDGVWRYFVPFIPALILLLWGVISLTPATILFGLALLAIMYELYKIKIKIENGGPWY